MAKQKKLDARFKGLYAYILVDRTKRTGLALLFGLLFVIISWMLFSAIVHERSWLIIAGPIHLFCVPLMLYPPVETWVYGPWQTKSRKYERHYRD